MGAVGTMASQWTPELETKVARLWEKHSDSQIAAIILSEDRVHFTRNAIIGKRHRMGGASASPRIREPKQPTVARPRRDGVGGQVQNINRARSPQPRLTNETIQLRCVEIVPRNVTLADLEENDCRYVYGDGDPSEFRFCGHPKFSYVREGLDVTSSYCCAHFHLTRGAGTQSERAATKVVAA